MHDQGEAESYDQRTVYFLMRWIGLQKRTRGQDETMKQQIFGKGMSMIFCWLKTCFSTRA